MNWKHLRIALGATAWAVLIAIATVALRRELSSSAHGPADVFRDVGRWVLDERSEFAATSDGKVLLAPGDPVLEQTADGEWRQVGVVIRTGGPVKKVHATSRIDVQLYDYATRTGDGRLWLEYHSTPTSLDWVVKTMISPEKRRRIADLIAASWAIHQREVVDRLQPVLRESMTRAIDAIESELPQVLKRHEVEFTALGDRYQSEILQQELVPLVRKHVLPVAMEELQPVAEEIGEALWRKVSLWRFTWRYLYDVSPLPERNRVQEEFDRFLQAEAIPEFESRSDQFLQTAERIVKRASSDPEVRRILRRNLRTVAEDEELREIVWRILRESVLDNQHMYQALEEYWGSREARQALKVASASFEPTVRTIGDMVFGTREQGVSPEFAKVLRLQILTKDRRWLMLHRDATGGTADATSDAIPMRVAAEPMPFPIEFDAQIQSPLTQTESQTSGATANNEP
jgi:hypothetical protein